MPIIFLMSERLNRDFCLRKFNNTRETVTPKIDADQ